MIDHSTKLSVSRQAILLGISRGSVYYQPRPVSDADLKLMHRIDKLHTGVPLCGQPDAAGLAGAGGVRGGAATCRHTDETDGDRGALSETEHLETGTWAQDLHLSAAKAARDATQSGLGNGHHLHPDGTWLNLSTAVLDWFTRRVLSCRLLISLEADFCIKAS